MRQAIKEESIKYSTRSSKPCRWHLEVLTYYAGMSRGRQQFGTVYCLMIDTGGSAVATNQIATQPQSYFK
ncbi:unnamed protein product [Adineta steineri]|uniref:Uncharacterized protein n=1 Tax=Adineta steineri TaxID=433720 RepID=A0A814DDM5_9BILA|nr:unnamed protein product [Adineta steineri]CAF4041407.1 unnamed protein product [Adineta steineri]